MLARVDEVSIDDLTEMAGELFSSASLSAACIGRDEDGFRSAVEPVSSELVAA